MATYTAKYTVYAYTILVVECLKWGCVAFVATRLLSAHEYVEWYPFVVGVLAWAVGTVNSNYGWPVVFSNYETEGNKEVVKAVTSVRPWEAVIYAFGVAVTHEVIFRALV